MRIYKCQVYDPYLGAQLSWHASKKEAEKVLRTAGHGTDNVGPENVTPYEIPAGKAGLITWLNIHFTSNNG